MMFFEVKKLITFLAIMGFMGAPPLKISFIASRYLFGGSFFNIYPDAPAQSALKILSLSANTDWIRIFTSGYFSFINFYFLDTQLFIKSTLYAR